jgi:hypothetical protein
MKPSMRQEVTLLVPRLGEKDEYGKPVTDPFLAKARVQYSTKTVRGTNGQTIETTLEIDLPADVYVEYGMEIEYTDWFGKVTKGLVRSMSESTNLSGTKVYFRTVFVG